MGTEAATSSESTQSADNSKEVTSQGGDSSVDFKALFEDTRSQLEETKNHSSKLAEDLEKVKGTASKYGETVERMRAAFSGDDDKVDPLTARVQSLEAEKDKYVQAALKAEKNGHPIPLTANLAIKSLEFQIQAEKDRADYQKQIKELREQVKQLGDPNEAVNRTAYSNMDSHLMSALHTIYGAADDYADTRNSQFQAISNRVISEIKDLQQNDPKLWDRISRDTKAQRNLVNHFVKDAIPPRARQIMDEEKIRQTPLTTDELMNAFREASDLVKQKPGDRSLMSQRDKIRQDIVARLMPQSKRGRGAKMNDVY